MKHFATHLSRIAGFAVAGLIGASFATGTAQSVVASLVQIVNTSANPVPSQDVDNPARQPVSFETLVGVSANATNGLTFQAYQVPAGKELVIDYVSMSQDVQNSEQVFSISFKEELQQGVNLILVPVSNLGSLATSPNFHQVVAGQPVAMYVLGGDFVDVGVATNGGPSGADLFVAWTGHLVNLP